MSLTHKKELPTRCAEDNATERNPSFFFVSLKIIYDVLWIYGFNNTDIEFEEVLDSDTTNENKPNADYQKKRVANFVSSISLDIE